MAEKSSGVQHDAAVEGHKSWSELADKERAIFEDIARGGHLYCPALKPDTLP